MSCLRGSEIASLVLGYLQSQQMDQIALNFAKESKYLHEDYETLKLGVKIRNLNKPMTLQKVIKDFIDTEDMVNEFFESEKKQHEIVPNELLLKTTLPDKVKYFFQILKSLRKDVPLHSPRQNLSKLPVIAAATRKRANPSNLCESPSEMDSLESSVPAINEQSSAKRRRIDIQTIDPELMFGESSDMINSQKSIDSIIATPIKLILPSQHQDPSLQRSASKPVYLNTQLLLKGIEENNISIDQFRDKSSTILEGEQMQDLLDSLTQACVQQSFGFEDYSSDTNGSGGNSDDDCEIVPTDNNELNTPIPIASTSAARYDLRSNRKSGSSVESKRKNKGEKLQILSNERVNLLQTKSVLDQNETPTIELSDTDCDTTSQPQAQGFNRQLQQSQLLPQQTGFPQLFDASTGFIYTIVYDTQFQSQSNAQPQYQAATSTVNTSNTIISNATTSNVIDESQFTVNDSSQVVMISNQETATTASGERFIVISSEDVANEGCNTVQSMQADQQPSSTTATSTIVEKSIEIVAEPLKNTQIEKDKMDLATAQLKQISSQKVVTPPKQVIRPHPNATKSLSTPRNKNPHVRVLDFNGATPNRYRLSGIEELQNESMSNTSRFFHETPHNRTIPSTLPSSAPPKVDSTIQKRRQSIEKPIESDVFVPIDENTVSTVISGGSETPKVRKSNRRTCSRTISTHKEIQSDVIEERSKRVAATKKKICPDDGDSNASEENNKKPDTDPTFSNEDAMAEWQRTRNASKNPELFEQRLREQNSKKQVNEQSTARKKRPPRTKKKTAAAAAAAAAATKRKKQTNKPAKNDSPKEEDVSLNSSLEADALNSTQLNLEARLLEENLKSAKKQTPLKLSVHRSAKKRSPIGKLQIKLPSSSPKNKALKRLRSGKNLVTASEKGKGAKTDVNSNSSVINNAAKGEGESNDNANIVANVLSNNQTAPVIIEQTTDMRKTEEEVAQNLIKMTEIITLQQEHKRKIGQSNDIPSSSDKVLPPPPEKIQTAEDKPSNAAAVIATNSNSMSNDKLLFANMNSMNLSMSALLDTPCKEMTDCAISFPQTPFGNFLPPQLTTPMVRLPSESLLNDSIFKNPNWPTPNFPITPGAMFSSLTPLKDDGEEIVYGAANRPTDYSSSSSYYKPDESDGIDRQIQASIQLGRKSVRSTDDIDDDSKIDDTTHNSSTSSSSSSSSSDSSDSDSESDSSSSSNSDTSQRSQRFDDDIEQQQQHQQHQDPTLVDNLMEEDITQEIKAHLVSTTHVNIAQNILLTEPEPPIVNDGVEQSKLLNEKLRRMQNTMRQQEMKNHEKSKPKPITKYQRTISEVKRDRLRAAVQTVSSPSKRKSTQPKKVVSIHSQQVYSDGLNVATDGRTEHTDNTHYTERLKPEAAGDNAIADNSVEESVEAIKMHIDNVGSDEMTTSKKNIVASTNLSKENLIEVLSEKQKKFDANRPKSKTEVIEALPLARTTRARARNRKPLIAPAKSIITKTVSKEPSNPPPKPTDTSAKTQRRSKENKPNAPSQNEKAIAKPADPPKVEESVKKPECNFETPAKQRLSREKVRDLFGDCTDIETPIKSPPRTAVVSIVPANVPAPKDENQSTKSVADSSIENDSSDDSDGSDSDDERPNEMVFSIDETDKKRFICIRENFYALPIKKSTTKPPSIQTKKVYLPEDVCVTLEPSEVMELYTQDVNSVVEMKKNKERTRNSKGNRAEISTEADAEYGKPLHTSTPSPAKAVTPKFNIKHKPATLLSPKSAKKQSVTKQNDFDGIRIDDILHQLHPTNE